ncbi:hypothetical protein AVENLUH5627_02664 [Acinetobacter venetianus]|uniref:Uncharacterized protein n=1 Tax=Acinetobacter venetianus TaxID=52133 RepID=A0A150HLA1_9GAMM|nr:hypothetical protein [Acinetobacter venetianus]KXZ65934.1 hypothetical protein AVENLUH5627_02664 [Acinetobacter venetianus]
MNAIQFIKEHGVEKAREVVTKHVECYTPEVFKYWSEQLHDYVFAPKYASCLVADLKRLVESVDLVESFNGVEMAKRYLEENMECSDSERLKQAIADYESIYKCTYCNGFGEVGCQFEGTFTCPDCNGDRYVGGEHV